MSPQSTKGTPPTGQTHQARYDLFSVSGGGGGSGGGGAGSTQSLPRSTGKTSTQQATNKYNTWASPAKASTSRQRSSSYSGGAGGGGQTYGGSSKNLASTSTKTGGSTRSLDRASTNTRVRIDEQGYARTYDASLTMRSDPGHITATGEYGSIQGRQPLPPAMTENQSKFVQERVTSVEKHFGELCTDFAAYNRKLSKVRDRGDVLARAVMTYAEHETLNHTTKAALRDFAENFAAVQDYRESEVRKIEAKVVEPLTLYGTACKHAKERLKTAFSARDKEMKQKKTLDKVKTKAPSDRHQISQAETNLQKASVDASMTSKALEKEIDGFEGKKLQDIKKILLDFVGVELMFHAKALEMYTNCYQGLSTMSEEDDLEEFRNSLRPSTAQSRLEMQRATSKSSLNAGSVGRRTPSGTPQGVRRTTHQVPNGEGLSTMNTTGTRSMYSDTYQDDDDDDDDDDEYETEEDEEYDQQQHQHSQHRYQSQPHSQARR